MDMPCRIVVIDRDPSLLEFFDEALGAEGYTVQCYLNGAVDVDALQLEPPDLLILELSPIEPRSALRVLELLRLYPTTSTVPVVVTSTSAPALERFAPQLGSPVRQLLVKPFSLQQLITGVTTLVAELPAV